MNNPDDKERLLPYIEDYLKEQDYYHPGKDKKFRCISGTHPDYHPSMSLDRKTNRVSCFSCKASYDIIGLVEKDKGYSYKQALDYLRQKYLGASPKPTQKADAKPTTQEAKVNDLVATLGNEKAIAYLRGRGFKHAQEIAQAFSVKNDEKGHIYLPHKNGKEYTDCQVRTSYKTIKSNRYRRIGNTTIYDNLQILSLPYDTQSVNIAICEGELDALSIYDIAQDDKEGLKGLYAIALSGGGNSDLLAEKLEAIADDRRKNYHFLLALDNDQHGKGFSKSVEAIVEELGFPYTTTDILGDYKDPNDRLQGDREGLLSSLKAYMKDFSNMESQEMTRKEKDREDYLSHNTAKNHLNALLSDFSNKGANLSIDTGFKALNGIFYGISQGVITLGALSSLGKTTLFLQIADQLAGQNKKEILYFSLEQSGKELVAKSLSRLTFLNAKRSYEDTAKARYSDSLMVTKAGKDGEYTKMMKDGSTRPYDKAETLLLNQSLSQYEQLSNRLYFITPQNANSLTIKEIEETIKKHIDLTGNKPIVFIDYLQIIASQDQHLTDKQAVDVNISNLRRICSLYGLLVFAISSVGRANYNANVDMASFKESGAIEYGSDILLGLNFTALDDIEEKTEGKNKNEAEAFIKATIKAEKHKDPRSVFLEVLKNRNGNTGAKAYFHYYQGFNTFLELDGKEGKENLSGALQTIENIEVSMKDDDLPF